MQNNLAITYRKLGLDEKALRLKREVYSGRLKLHGEEHPETLIAANNCASSLISLEHFEEARSLMRETMPVARRVLGESHAVMLKMRWNYALALYKGAGATLDDLREAVRTLAEIEPIARRVLGGAHPLTKVIERDLRRARDALRARETQPRGA